MRIHCNCLHSFAHPNQEGWHSLSWGSAPPVRCWKRLKLLNSVPLYLTSRMSIHQYLHKIPQLWKHNICFLKVILFISFTYLLFIFLKLKKKKLKLQMWQIWFYLLKALKIAFKHSHAYNTQTYLWRTSLSVWIFTHITVNTFLLHAFLQREFV